MDEPQAYLSHAVRTLLHGIKWESTMQVTVIMATYRRSGILFNTLYSFTKLNNNNFSWEIIVVDNADDAETRRTIDHFKNILPLKFMVETKPGKNSALNSGLKRASGDLIVFTDDDILATRHWLEKMVSGAQRWPNAMFFGGKVLPYFPIKGFRLPPSNEFYKQAYTVADWDLPEGPYQANKVWGPNMAVRSAIFKQGFSFNPKVGPTGKNYIMGSESEFTHRLSLAGFTPVFLPESIVYHQIRKDQLSLKWILGRAFRAGRSVSWYDLNANGGVFAKEGLMIIKRLLLFSLKSFVYLFISHEKSIHLSIQICKMIGMLYQRKLALSDSTNY